MEDDRSSRGGDDDHISGPGDFEPHELGINIGLKGIPEGRYRPKLARGVSVLGDELGSPSPRNGDISPGKISVFFYRGNWLNFLSNKNNFF
jgi:hypothetical protein